MSNQRDLFLPRLGETMEEGTVVAWLKQPGETFKRGDIIAEIETDKTIVEMPALEAGVLEEILAPPGTKLAVGKALARISGGSAATPTKPATTKPTQQAKVKPARKSATAVKSVSTGSRVLASPNARRVAAELGIDFASVSGTGRGGRITAVDVQAAQTGSTLRPTTAGSEVDQATGIAVQFWPARRKTKQTPWLLLHGLFGNCASWSGLAASLTDAGADVYALDLPGHGNSSPAPSLKPAAIATQLQSALRKRYAGQLRLIGISLGAVFAAEFAGRDRNIKQLTLLCPAGLGPTSNSVFIKQMLAAADGADIAPALVLLGTAANALGPKAVAKMATELQQHADELKRMANAWFPQGTQKLSLLAALTQLNIPVKAIFGLDDAILPWQDAAHLPDHVAAHFISDAGHMPHLDRPDRVLALINS